MSNMKTFLLKSISNAAKFHIEKANEMILRKTESLAIYGIDYKKTLSYAFLELNEKLHFLMFNFWYSLINKKYETK